MTRFTEQQTLAIETRDVSVGLAAGAGCGKTFVLTQRFLSHLDPQRADRVELSQIVAITFTEKAAREMRDRVRGYCAQLVLNSGDDADYWLALSRQLDSARIGTIHSFCGTLLRSHAVEARVDPRFSIIEAGQAKALLSELIDALLRERLAERDADLMGCFPRLGLSGLRELLAIFVDSRQEIDFEQWAVIDSEELLNRWEHYFRHIFLPLQLRQLLESEHAATVEQISKSFLPADRVLAGYFANLHEAFAELAQSNDPAAVLEQIQQNARVSPGNKKKYFPDEEIYEQYKTAAKDLRDACKDMLPLLKFDREICTTVAGDGLTLLRMAEELNTRYESRKQELGCLDFQDLLIGARNLLVQHEDVRRRVARGIRVLLVDEFQDTDRLQADLVRALCDNRPAAGKLFIVGDHKQSIYRFRQADPQVFRDLRGELAEQGRLPLTRNFRSQPAILNFVNALFHRRMEEYEPLHADRVQVASEPAIEFLWAQTPERLQAAAGEKVNNNVEDLRRAEAEWIARRLRQLIDEQVPLVYEKDAAGNPQARPAKPGDIALLFRAMTSVQYYEQALREYGFDYYLVGGQAFYAQQEIYDLHNLLRALDVPGDQISLAGALRSSFFALTDESLFLLGRYEGGLAAGLMSPRCQEELAPDQIPVVRRAAATLRRLREEKDRLTISELIQLAISLTGYDASLLAEFMGERKLANLQKLIEQARRFEQNGFFCLADFIRQLSENVAKQPDEPLAATHGESADVIKLMSIHQSKGLEFPIVVICDLERLRNRTGPAGLFDPELGPLLRSAEIPCSGYKMQQQMEKLADEEETTRLLYVAATRAADYLILSAGVEDPDKPKELWRKLLAEEFCLTSGRHLGPVPRDCSPPQVRVTLEPPETDYRRQSAAAGPPLEKLLDQVRQAAVDHPVAAPRTVLPIARDNTALREFSFSSLRSRFAEQGTSIEPATTNVIETSRSAGSQLLGQLVHAILAEAVPDYVRDQQIMAPALEELAHWQAEKLLTAEPPAELINEAVTLAAGFFASPRAQRLLTAEEIHTEIDYLLPWPTSNTGLATTEGCQLQGVIDCLYRAADGQWSLVDFKTNNVRASGVHEAAQQYLMQLYVYALAVESALGTAPDELVLHFLRPGTEYTLHWDNAARETATTMINDAIAAARQGAVATP